MKSKEALEIIRSVDGSISVVQTINECCDIIKNDLEVLNILKKKIEMVIFKANKVDAELPKDKIIIHLDDCEDEEIRKIARWLLNHDK